MGDKLLKPSSTRRAFGAPRRKRTTRRASPSPASAADQRLANLEKARKVRLRNLKRKKKASKA